MRMFCTLLREEYTLKVFENTVFRRIFGSKRDEMMRCCGKFYNELFHNLYFSPNVIRIIISRRMKWEGHLALMGEKRNKYRI
jgi:hypothetical protein